MPSTPFPKTLPSYPFPKTMPSPPFPKGGQGGIYALK